MAILEVCGLEFSYGERPVFENLNFDLQKGGLLAVLGPNGSGKTTLFRCVLALEKRYKGGVFVEGEDIRKKKPRELAHLMAYLPQRITPVFNYSVTDMVLMGTAAGEKDWTVPESRHYENALLALEETGISELARRDFRELSGGEQQLVLIARALAQRAKILVMDEPCANLDYGNQIRLMEKIRLLCEKGRSILLSSHDPNHAFRFADRVLVIHNQKTAAFGSPDEVLTEGLLSALYGVDIKICGDDNRGTFCIAYHRQGNNTYF
ncbi:MAG: ABC transporter ATP-binding protein [Treponema sp.]|nr:ABC transporter ATP-binding protein [Treponema sp.]